MSTTRLRNTMKTAPNSVMPWIVVRSATPSGVPIRDLPRSETALVWLAGSHDGQDRQSGATPPKTRDWDGLLASELMHQGKR